MSEWSNATPPAKAEHDPQFPHAPQQWTKDQAQRLAQEEGLDIGEDHWEVIRALQEYFSRNDAPRVRELRDALDEKFHGKGGSRYLYALFPRGPVAQGCRLAGLRAPAGSTDPSFGSVQ